MARLAVGLALIATLKGIQPAAAQHLEERSSTGAEDAAALREVRAGQSSRVMGSWEAEPCGEGWDDHGRGWGGVRCTGLQGRVGAIRMADTGLRGELLPLFARLGALQALALGSNWALSGDVADLAAATTLRSLDLSGCPLVRGELETLAPLGRLGLGCSLCDGGVGVLWLAGSGVFGPVAALRALPGLGDEWGLTHFSDFTPCSAFGGHQASATNATWGTGSPGCEAARLGAVDNATDLAGVDECACCGGSARVRDARSHACESVPARLQASGAGRTAVAAALGAGAALLVL